MTTNDIGMSQLVDLAQGGNVEAQYLLGARRYAGDGVRQSFAEAVRWYLQAAAQGDARAQFSLGSMYASGKGVRADWKKAAKWYTLAAKQGLPAAHNSLSALLEKHRFAFSTLGFGRKARLALIGVFAGWLVVLAVTASSMPR